MPLSEQEITVIKNAISSNFDRTHRPILSPLSVFYGNKKFRVHVTPRKNHPGFNHEVESDFIADGAYGAVYRLVGKISSDANGDLGEFCTYPYHKSGEDKQKVIKLFNQGGYQATPIDEINGEVVKNPKSLKSRMTLRGSRPSYLPQLGIVMREIPGMELFEAIDEPSSELNRLNDAEKKAVVYALFMALKQQVASEGVIHRDIKPENIKVLILRQPELSVKVTIFDFAFAIPVSTNVSSGLVGSPGYMAPEIIHNRPYDAAVDTFAMAVTAALIFGVDLILDSDDFSTVKDAVDTYHNRPELAQLPPDIEPLIRAMLHPDPNQRMSLDKALDKLYLNLNQSSLDANRLYTAVMANIRKISQKLYQRGGADNKYHQITTALNDYQDAVGHYVLAEPVEKPSIYQARVEPCYEKVMAEASIDRKPKKRAVAATLSRPLKLFNSSLCERFERPKFAQDFDSEVHQRVKQDCDECFTTRLNLIKQ